MNSKCSACRGEIRTGDKKAILDNGSIIHRHCFPENCTCTWGCPKHTTVGQSGSQLLLQNRQRIGTMRSIESYVGFWKIVPRDNSLFGSREKMCAIANDVGIRKIFDEPRYQLTIEELVEMTPADDGPADVCGTIQRINGFNLIKTFIEDGRIIKQKFSINLLMRTSSGQNLPYEEIIDTLLHELAHCHHPNHSAEFYAEWNCLRKIYSCYRKTTLPTQTLANSDNSSLPILMPKADSSSLSEPASRCATIKWPVSVADDLAWNRANSWLVLGGLIGLSIVAVSLLKASDGSKAKVFSTTLNSLDTK